MAVFPALSTAILVALAASIGVDAFSATPRPLLRPTVSSPQSVSRFDYGHRRPRSSSMTVSLKMSDDNNGNFDMSRPTFDLYSLKNVRGDTLIRYNSLNQSEPLRINLYLLLTLSLFSYSAISEAVLGEPATIPGTIATGAGGLFLAYRFVRECKRRVKKLNRMEKESNAGALTIRIPTGPFADRPYGDVAFDLATLRGKRKILAICGNASQLKEALVGFRTLRRRFVQAEALVVAVPTDGSCAEDWGVGESEIRSAKYLAQVGNAAEWVEYFRNLVGGDDDDDGGKDMGDELVWFGLTNSGKSFGSGAGIPPRPIEILGQNLLPLEILSEDDADETILTSNGDEAKSTAALAVLSAQKQFYAALTTGDLPAMNEITSSQNAAEVDEVLTEGGRIDNWTKCLEDGARPAGMVISSSDALVVSENEAYSTCIEFPEVDGVDYSATLLAVQKWRRRIDDGGWELELHQTIPWSSEVRAGGTLRCDCRGCTALTRAPDRQYNFRGMLD